MPTRKYMIQWVIDDRAAKSTYKDAMAASKALEAQHLRTLRAAEAALAGTGKGGGVAASAAVNGAKATADATIAHAKRASAERGRIYTQEEARAKAAEQEARARNKRMVDDAVLAERARARAVTAAGVGGMHAVAKAQRAAVDDYSGVQFKAINQKLRGVYKPGNAEADRINAQARLIDEAIAAGAIKKSTVLHRGASLRSYGLTDLPKPGDVIKDKAFGSTSVRRDIAEGFSKGVMWEIHARKGTKAADVSHLTGGGEAELLLARNQALKVRSTRVDEQGRSVIVAEAMRSQQEQRERDAMATTLRLRRAAEATESQRVRAAQAEMRRGSGGRSGVGAGIAAAGAADKGPTVDVGYYRVIADQVNKEISLEKRKAAEIKGIHDKAIMEEYAAGVKRSRTQEQQAERDAAAAVKRAERQARAVERLEAGPAAKAATYRRRDLTEAEAHAVALNRITDVRNKRHIEGIAKVMGEQRLSFAEAIHSAIGFDSALTKVGGAMLAVGAGKTLFQAVVGSMNDARDASKAMARQVIDTSAALREIALIKNKFAPDMEEIKEHLDLRRASGLTQAEAVTYKAELLNQLGTVSPEKFPEAERAKLAIEGGKMAARGGGGESAIKNRATMQGLLPDYVKKRADGIVHAADVMAMADAVDTLNQMGAASNAVATAQSAELITGLTTGDMAGTFHDPRQAVALNTIASKFAKNASATATMQALRETRGFTKFRVGKGMVSSQAESLKAAGITEQMDPAQSMVAMFKFAEKEMKPGEAFDAFLARRGFRNKEGNEEMQRFFNEYRQGNFQRIMAQAGRPLDVNAPGAKARVFAASDVGRDLISQAMIDAARAKQGELVKEHLLRVQEAEPGYIAAGKETSTLGGLAEWAVGLTDKAKGREALLSSEAVRAARRDAGLEPGLGLGPIGTGAFAAYGGMFGPAAGRAAGSIAGFMTGENAEMVRQLKEIADSNKRIAATNEAMLKQGRPANGAPAPAPIPIRGPANAPLRN